MNIQYISMISGEYDIVENLHFKVDHHQQYMVFLNIYPCTKCD